VWVTALDYAIAQGPRSLVEILLAMGADPNPVTNDGFPPLFMALERDADDRYDVLALLLSAGADVNGRGVNDYTVLHQAACKDDARAVRLLLEHGADPEARTRIDNYTTPLEEAEQFGHAVGAAALRGFGVPVRGRR
jgi:ankyrin repeat protein